jgi:cytoskeleton protein RodZ
MLPTVAAGVTSVLLVLFAIWLYHRPEPLPTPSAVATVAPAPASVAAAPASLPAAAAASVAAAAAAPATQAARSEPARVEAPRSDAAAADAKPATSGAQVRVALRFSGESWVEVYDPANQPLVYQLFDAGQAREVSATPPLRVFIGQAGAVAVTIDGKRVDLAALTKRDATARFTIGAGGTVR